MRKRPTGALSSGVVDDEGQCIRRAICPLDQVRMPESNDLHRAGVVTPRGGRILGPLPRGAKSSRAGQSADPGAPTSRQGVGTVYRKQRLGGMLNFYCREPMWLASSE